MTEQLTKMWMTGNNPEGQPMFININAVVAIQNLGGGNFVVYLGGGDRILLTGCTFAEEYPAI
ncbi:MAG: hypothetical protein MUO99_01900 [Dehalococcoidales bacterium]|nr:hypothetical protein [Dehalococcoidales bacterium]